MNASNPAGNWWDRNWKWFVPVGCLTVLLLFAAFIALILTFVFGMMKHSTAYEDALRIARSNPVLVAAIGTPIQDGYFVSGNISETGPSGSAQLAIPISGPRGAGTLYLEASKAAGKWKFSTLVVELDHSHERIDLLDPTQAAPRARGPTIDL